MSDPTYPPAPAARRRPSSVTISSYLLIIFAIIQVIGLVITLSISGALREAYREAYAGTNMANQAETFGVVSSVGAPAVAVLVAVGLVILALLNNRGKNASRIVTWVLGGLVLCCGGGILALSAAGNAFGMNNAGNANAPSQEQIRRALEGHLPAWYGPVSTIISIIGLLALLAALILLALPSANEFFRRPQPAWEPPVPGSTYPGYPAPGRPGESGGQSGYQQYGGQSGYQQYGGQSGYEPPPPPGSQPPPGSSNPPNS